MNSIDTDRVFHALGDGTRRAIVERLSVRPVSVSDLARPLEISVTAVMQHLRMLEECGLVRSEKIGRTRTCQLEPAGLSAIEQWVYERRKTWERRFDKLGDVLTDTGNTTDTK